MTAERHCPALFIGACASGQGKTTIVAALARHHRRQGRRVRVFKTGPDFLDPMILERASGAPVEPLDLWMVGEALCRRKLYEASGEADLILIEGAMGLFDGAPSGADLAAAFGIPVLALIDARGMGQTLGAVAMGLMHYGAAKGIEFWGISANRVASARHAEMIAAGMPPELPYLGPIPRLEAVLPSRHLGLVQAAEIPELDARLAAAADQIQDLALARLPEPCRFVPPTQPAGGTTLLPAETKALQGLRIAVARDLAFAFIYPENLKLLQALGAELIFFSPLADQCIEADAIWLPGGYPELHLTELAANRAMKQSLHAHARAGRPIYAECGGMLYLLERLTDHQGQTAELIGLLPGEGQMQGRLAGLGMQSLVLPQGELRGHSFHHSTMRTPLAPVSFGRRQAGGQPGEPFYHCGPIRASYLHLYFPSAPRTAAELFMVS
ncbi:cobyrinate a,c-diamide synthase [Caldichromatium japonicum]|uniref:Cobyrinate a,c-diamide synthase n=1 Tax=Caldichromatium japonicum TaxID=2699430 RepID=A0A6G7VCF9_9GAMM|nr:cobyrinate a,c-diamide synthase [Caldichromatium japonicum]QIK37590.1 cobyrinate a,c-diamide synthase [Caldichromatium japonicum]